MKAAFKNRLLFFAFMLCSFAACTQTQWLDSVKKVIATQKPDTSKVISLIGLSSAYAGSYADTGLRYAQRALALAENLHFERGIFWAEINAAGALMILGNYPLDLDYCFKALALAKKRGIAREISFANGYLADCYFFLGEYNTSLKYEREVVKIAEQSSSDEICFIWAAMARAFEGIGQNDSALLYATKAYEKIKNRQNLNAESLISPILGNAFAGRQEYDSALFYYKKGLSLTEKSRLETDLIEDYNGIASVYKAKGNIDSAIWYAKKTLAEKITKTYPAGLLKAGNMLSDIYEMQDKNDSALKYLKLSIILKDSLFNREKTVAIQNIIYKEQEKQQEIKAARLKLRNQSIMYFLLAGLTALLVAAGIVVRNKRLKQLQNVRNSIADDLHDDIGSTLTNISILSELGKQNLDSKENANKFLTRISEEVNTTSQALDDIIWSVNVRNDSIDEIVLRMRRYAGELFDAGRLKYELRFDDDLSGIKLSMEQRRDLYLIFKEAVNNIYKHANASVVAIELNKREHQIVMRIKDNGKGFETKPSHRNGFKNMQSRAKKWKGLLQIESALCKGTCVVLFFPLK